jgi:hypothetical protein
MAAEHESDEFELGEPHEDLIIKLASGRGAGKTSASDNPTGRVYF